MKQLDLLEQELKLMLENIGRVREYKRVNQHWKTSSSRVVGELKHRAVVLKQRLSLIREISTEQLWTRD